MSNHPYIFYHILPQNANIFLNFSKFFKINTEKRNKCRFPCRLAPHFCFKSLLPALGSHFSLVTKAFFHIYDRTANHCYCLPRSLGMPAFSLPFQQGLLQTVEIQQQTELRGRAVVWAVRKRQGQTAVRTVLP